METLIEREENGNNVRRVRHVIRCKYCGHRVIVQEIILRHTPQGLIRVSRIT